MTEYLSKRRLVENEKKFKALNDTAEQTLKSVLKPSDPISFICECSNESCVEHINLMTKEYESIHAGENQFFVKPGHETVEVEEVVQKSAYYFVVKKY